MTTRLLGITLGVVTATFAAVGLANPLPAIQPRAENTGFSTIEQRYVYAPPEEGEFTVPIPVGAGPLEVGIATPEMCAGEMNVTYSYSKSDNKVRARIKGTGMPYRLDYTRTTDVSTQFNIHPVSIEDGKWQVWTIARTLEVYILAYYDGLTLQLLGTEYEYPDGPPPGSIPVPIAGAQMICSPIFEGDEDGNVDFTWEWDYDAMIDAAGNGGTVTTGLPVSLCTPDKLVIYYKNGGVPPDQAMSWDDVLNTVNKDGIVVATSLEPDPKPEELISRDNIMLGHVGNYPNVIPPGYTVELNSRTLRRLEPETCTITEYPDWQGPFYNLCTGF
jgi:hypothetical protein